MQVPHESTVSEMTTPINNTHQDHSIWFKKHRDHNLWSTVLYQHTSSKSLIHRSFHNHHYLWFRNGIVASSVGIDFRFLQFPWFHVRSSNLSSEEIFNKEIKVSWSRNLIFVSFDSIKLLSDTKQAITSILSHLRVIPTWTTYRDPLGECPGRLGA